MDHASNKKSYKIWLANLKGDIYFGELGVDGRIILNLNNNALPPYAFIAWMGTALLLTT